MIYSYVAKTVEHNGWGGVCRFDFMLRSVFPGLHSTVQYQDERITRDDLVITDNHLSTHVPDSVRTIVVHHGCAKTHFDRDTAWRTQQSTAIVAAQERMFSIPNRTFVAPSAWVSERFAEIAPPGYEPILIPHWVPEIHRLPQSGKPIIIGDWRDPNKGSRIWRKLAEAYPEWEFRPLNFKDDVGRHEQYGPASLYLCLSLSEGGSYAMCDAEAAELPIVTTDVGNYKEFDDCHVIPWKARDNRKYLEYAIAEKLCVGREKPSFYRDYTFDVWKSKWEALAA